MQFLYITIVLLCLILLNFCSICLMRPETYFLSYRKPDNIVFNKSCVKKKKNTQFLYVLVEYWHSAVCNCIALYMCVCVYVRKTSNFVRMLFFSQLQTVFFYITKNMCLFCIYLNQPKYENVYLLSPIYNSLLVKLLCK